MYNLLFRLNGLPMDNRTKRLLYLIERDFGGSQTKFAQAINRSNAQVNALVKERKPIGDALALNIERTLELGIGWFDIPITKINDQETQIKNAGDSNNIDNIQSSIGLIESADATIPLNKNEVELPFYTDIRLKANNGFAEDIQNYNNQKLRFSRLALSKNNINPSYAICILADGNSMEPAIPNGATVGINCEDKILRDDMLYAINHNGLLKIRILRKKSSSSVLLQSYNTNAYPDEEVNLEDISIIGRIFWWSAFI